MGYKKIIHSRKQKKKFDEIYSETADIFEGERLDRDSLSETERQQILEEQRKVLASLEGFTANDAAETRLYFPPKSFLSHANEKGTELSESQCIISMGTGNNIWIVQNLEEQRVWGEFWVEEETEDEELKDTKNIEKLESLENLDEQQTFSLPQLYTFENLETKEITDYATYKNKLHQTLKKIIKNNHILLGTLDIQGNGFQSCPFPEIEFNEKKRLLLENIHHFKRTHIQFPQEAPDGWISAYYFAQTHVLNRIPNLDTPDILELAHLDYTRQIYSHGSLIGIACIENNAAYLFFLTNDLSVSEEPKIYSEIDEAMFDIMVEMIRNSSLCPVSWFKIDLGLDSVVEMKFREYVIKDPEIKNIKTNYKKYRANLSKSFLREKRIRDKK